MLDRETLITLFETAAGGLAFNLGFIPAEKLDWKPAPEAKSAIEIVNHSGQIAYIQTLLGDTEIHFDPSTYPDFAVG